MWVKVRTVLVGGNYRAALLYWQDWGKYSGMITARILNCVLNYDLWQLRVVSVLLCGKQSERIFLNVTHKDMHCFTHFMVFWMLNPIIHAV